MKILFCALMLTMVAGLSGCGKCSRTVTHWTGNFTYKCSDSGIEYVQSDSGVAVHLDQNGKPVKCSKR